MTPMPAAAVPLPEPFAHRLRVRYAECDQQGVVFNGHYLFFYDVALTELWRQAAEGYQAMVCAGVDVVVAEASLRFLAGARFDDEIDIVLAVEHLGTTSMTVNAVFRRGADVLAEARVRHVFVEVAGGGKTPVPERVRAGLAGYTATAAPGGPAVHQTRRDRDPAGATSRESR